MRSKKYVVRSMSGFGILLFLFLTSQFLLPTNTHAQEVDILWQGNVYTPPFYEGRPIWSKQSNITFYAIPNIPGIINTSLLEYKWTKDSLVQGSISGIGKNSFSFSDSIFGKPVDIKIDILASDGKLLASNSMTLSPRNPELVVYENNPLYGILFNKEVGNNYKINKAEVTLSSFPLFFSTIGRNSNILNYLWITNSGGSENVGSVTYRAPEGVSGSSRITTRISNINKARQNFEKSFLIQFNNTNNDF